MAAILLGHKERVISYWTLDPVESDFSIGMISLVYILFQE